MALDVPLKPVETILFQNDVVAVAKFRCPVADPLFHDSGPCSNHTFVFPRTRTAIVKEDGGRFIGSPNVAAFYNQHERYRREALSAMDATDWYVVADDVLRSILRELDAEAADDAERPFRFAAVTVPHQAYMAQRRLFDAVTRGETGGAADVEEAVFRILWLVLAAAYRNRKPVSPRMRAAVVEAQRLIALRPDENLSLRQLAAATSTSPFQLCRAFRCFSGQSITSYRQTLRVRLALDLLRDSDVDLSTLALDVGFSSHSHFTAVFRRIIGVPPSAYRGGFTA